MGEIFYGYVCDNNTKYKIDLINEYLDIVRRQVLREKYCREATIKACGEPKHCHSNLGKCIDDISLLAAKVDESKIEKGLDVEIIEDGGIWAANNPQCASINSYYLYARDICKTLNIEFKIEKESDRIQAMCDLTFEVTKNSIPCDFLIQASLVKQVCDMGIHLDVKKEECLAEWEILLERNSDCSVDFNTYITSKETIGLTYEIIEFLIMNGLGIKVVNGEIEIIGLLRDYKWKELVINGTVGEIGTESEYYKNPKKFITKYLNEYNLTNTIIEKLI